MTRAGGSHSHAAAYGSSLGGVAPATTFTSPADALRDEEIARTRTFIKLGWIAALGAIAMMYAVPGNRQIALALLAVLGVTVLGSIATYLQLRTPARYDARQLNILAFAAIVCVQLGILYTGAFRRRRSSSRSASISSAARSASPARSRSTSSRPARTDCSACSSSPASSRIRASIRFAKTAPGRRASRRS